MSSKEIEIAVIQIVKEQYDLDWTPGLNDTIEPSASDDNFVQTIMALEETFDMVVSDEEAGNIHSLNDMVELVIIKISPRNNSGSLPQTNANSAADEYYNKGLECAKGGDIDKAVSYYEKVISIDPFYADAYKDIGILYDNLWRRWGDLGDGNTDTDYSEYHRKAEKIFLKTIEVCQQNILNRLHDEVDHNLIIGIANKRLERNE